MHIIREEEVRGEPHTVAEPFEAIEHVLAWSLPRLAWIEPDVVLVVRDSPKNLTSRISSDSSSELHVPLMHLRDCSNQFDRGVANAE